jgi:hypothetical protein
MSNHELNYSVSDEELLKGDYYNDRTSVGEIDSKEGEVMQIDPINMGIHYEGPNPILLPCNLPEAFQQTGLKIIFSGHIKEVKSNENVPGQPFVLTHIERCS